MTDPNLYDPDLDHSKLTWRQWWAHVKSVHFKGYRTILLNGLMVGMVLMGQLLSYLAVFDWTAVLSPGQAAWVILAVNVLNILLRSCTTGPIGTKQ
jgi:hypothetical protein